jgi:endonuclease/exonuclease/phosphatase family metal-dependent hydrolase
MQIRIVTYNIKSGRHHPQGLEAVARIVSTLAPDILGLQEVDEGMRRSGGVAQTDWLSRRLRMAGLFAPAMAYDGGQYGIALLSSRPISAHERRPLFRPVYVDAGSRPRHDSEPRVMLGARLALPRPGSEGSYPLNIVATHLGLTPDQRLVQAREVADFAWAWAGTQPLVVLGDFNCNPGAPELAPLRASLVDACNAQGVAGEARVTFPIDGNAAAAFGEEPTAIDYVWVSPGVNITSARVLMDESRASDHRPLVVDVEL